jgi:hypothetical protein
VWPVRRSWVTHAQCSAQLPEACHSDPFKVWNTSAPPSFGVVGAEPAQAGQHVDRGDVPVAAEGCAGRGQNPVLKAVGHHPGSVGFGPVFLRGGRPPHAGELSADHEAEVVRSDGHYGRDVGRGVAAAYTFGSWPACQAIGSKGCPILSGSSWPSRL